MRQLTFIVISIQLHHLLVDRLPFSCRIAHTVLLQILEAKRRLADATPRIMLNPPRLCIGKRLPSSPISLAGFGISPEVRAHEVIAAIDVEFAQQELGGPGSILHMEQPEIGIGASTNISVQHAKAIKTIDFLSDDFPLPVLRLVFAQRHLVSCCYCHIKAERCHRPALIKSITSTRPHLGSSWEYSLCHGRAGDCGRASGWQLRFHVANQDASDIHASWQSGGSLILLQRYPFSCCVSMWCNRPWPGKGAVKAASGDRRPRLAIVPVSIKVLDPYSPD